MAEKCIILGDGDIVGPGVRISLHIQCFLAIYNAFLSKKQANDSLKTGHVSILSLIISALVQYKTSGIHDIFLIILTFMISQYTIVSILAEYGIKGKFKIGSPTLLYEIITLGLCFNVWLWATIKQRLPKQECGDQVRMYIIFISYGVIYLFMTIKQTYNWIINNKNDENDGNLEISEEGTIKVVVFQVMFLIIGIVMIEMTARKNSISGIWDWNFGQIMTMIVTSIDVVCTIFRTIRKCIVNAK